MSKATTMEKELFEGYSEEERFQMLKDNADGVIEDHKYMKTFSKKELQDMKNELSDNAIILLKLNNKKKDLLAELKAEAEFPTQRQAKLVEGLEMKAEVRKETVYKMIDHATGMVGFYASNCTLIDERPMDATDGQRTIMATLREGTND